MNAIDLSYATLDPSALGGVELVIQNLWTGTAAPGPRIGNLRAAAAAGKRTAGYIAINPAADNVGLARAMMPDDLWRALEFVALDIELWRNLTPAKIRADSDKLAALLPWAPRVLYTVRSFWRDVLADDQTFAADHWLWDARTGDPVPAFVPYGGWTADRVIGVQTSGSSQLGTMIVDYDQFRLEVLDVEDPKSAARRQLIGAVLTDDMARLVADLVLFGVLPAGTVAQKPAL